MVDQVDISLQDMHNVYTYKLYDFLLTIADEIEYVWSSRPTLADWLFYATKYSAVPEICLQLLFCFGGLDSSTKCRVVGGYICFSLSVGMLLSQGIVALRTWALWNGSRAIQLSCGIVGLAACAVCSYLTLEWILRTRFAAIPQLRGCTFSAPYRKVYIAWVAFSVVDVVLLALTVIKGREHYRPGSPRLASMLYRDGERVPLHELEKTTSHVPHTAFAFFSFTLVLSIANVLVAAFATERFQGLVIGFQRILYLNLACRVIINLRAAARRQDMTIQAVATEEFARSARCK
ncbi:hypothetical protein AURDEDRAFT_166697 [Auricularia subglabra TFB-10046 SS5]|nr:hypothetical protein AURDEDRAFT_166697 [Auricularia subglabra TFB-10046 SS5]